MSDKDTKLRLGGVEAIPFPKRVWHPGEDHSPGDVRAEIAKNLSNLQEMRLGDLAGRVRGLLDFAEDAGHPEVGEEMVSEVGRVLGKGVLGKGVLEAWLKDAVDLATKKAVADTPTLTSCEKCKLSYVASRDVAECPNCARMRAVAAASVCETDEWWIKAKPTFDEVLQPRGQDGPVLKMGLVPLGFKANAKEGDTETLLVAIGQVSLRPMVLLIAPECPDGQVVDFYTGVVQSIGGVDPVPISLFQPTKWRELPEMPRWQLWKMRTLRPAEQANLLLRFDEPLARPKLVKAMLWCVGVDG